MMSERISRFESWLHMPSGVQGTRNPTTRRPDGITTRVLVLRRVSASAMIKRFNRLSLDAPVPYE